MYLESVCSLIIPESTSSPTRKRERACEVRRSAQVFTSPFVSVVVSIVILCLIERLNCSEHVGRADGRHSGGAGMCAKCDNVSRTQRNHALRASQLLYHRLRLSLRRKKRRTERRRWRQRRHPSRYVSLFSMIAFCILIVFPKTCFPGSVHHFIYHRLRLSLRRKRRRTEKRRWRQRRHPPRYVSLFEYRVSEYILLRSFTLYDLQIFTNSPFTDSDSRCEARGEGRGNGGNEVTRQGELFAFDYCHQETHFLFSINFFTFL